jgi:sporulation protein YlmC with PRC-barrel domain
MEIDIDISADVIGRDGKKLGTVALVVVQPPKMHLTDIVVSTGAIERHEVVVPANLVRGVENGEVHLSIDKDELRSYPDYLEVHYQMPPPGWAPPADFYYPPAAVLLPATASIPELVDERVNAPPGTRGIAEDMDVETIDGHKVGTVDAVDVDLATEDITELVVKQGFLFTHDTRIPVKDVREIRDGTVILNLTKNQIQRVEQEQRQHQD